MIKEGLQESKDYIICTKSSYEYLNSIYSHKLPEIIRYSIPINENDSIIEVTLKTLNALSRSVSVSLSLSFSFSPLSHTHPHSRSQVKKIIDISRQLFIFIMKKIH